MRCAQPRFRQKALEELDELMRGDAMTYMNDTGPSRSCVALFFLGFSTEVVAYVYFIHDIHVGSCGCFQK